MEGRQGWLALRSGRFWSRSVPPKSPAPEIQKQSPTTDNRATPKPELEGVELVRAVLSNLHQSLKWLWLITMGLALANAIQVYSKLLDPSQVTSPFGLAAMFFNEHTVVFLSFMLVFVRFYFGDSRFLDLSYEETHYSRGLESELSKYSGGKRALDILLLINHGVFFFFMSFHVGNTAHYLYFFIVLMLVNVFWLLLQVAVGINAQHPHPDPLIGNMKGTQVLVIWSVNNLFFVIAITFTLFSTWEHRLVASLILTLLNSFVDLRLTWKYYFPPLRELEQSRANRAS